MQRQTDARQIKTLCVIPVASFKLEPILVVVVVVCFLFDHAILIKLSELVVHQFNKNKTPHPHLSLTYFLLKIVLSYGVCI